MKVSENPKIRMINGDSLEAMKGMEDNAYELAVVDPPYGIDINSSGRLVKERGWEYSDWDKQIPKAKYFEELFRVSQNQIIWGGNYFNLNATRCYLIWDKQQPQGVSFASSELAWTSFDKSTKTFYMRPQGRNPIHPTQKPVALYKWLLKNYATEGDKILDTHGGSGSICIACYDMGFDLDWYELDEDYYETAVARFKEHKKQGQLFTPRQTYQPVQTKLEIS